ncbi:annexin A6-like [Liolophura sinensis]|uniref:annexin A6-like n=1 Tax=Liolophura sinensis TaxID=3198878 RepID=UPI0031592196
MPSAGAICPPQIIPLREPYPGLASNRVDSSTFLELYSESPGAKIYFTTDGTKPSPFQRIITGREVTFKYIAPFTLKPGKRTLKCVAVSRDGMRESDVVTKTLTVDDIGFTTTTYTSTSEYDSTSTCVESDDDKPRSRSRTKPRKKGSPSRRPLQTTPREAWAASNTQIDRVAGTSGYDSTAVPEGPFNPTNYSGTQINVWGSTSGQSMQVNPNGTVTMGPGNPTGASHPNTQYGFLTEQMIKNCKPTDKCLTVGDLRKALEDQKPKEPPPSPVKAIEYPVYKDPPVNAISPGKGEWKEQILHIYSHMLEYAKGHTDFKIKVSEPKMGKMLSAEMVDEGDGYRVSVVLAKPGVPRGAVRKPPKVKEAPPPSTTKRKPSTSSTKETKPKPKPKADPYFDMETENLNTEGTVKPYPNFNAEQDCEVLRSAMKGIGTDEEAIINIMAYRSSPQRVEIVSTYKTLFGKDLIEDFKSELSGNLLETVKRLCLGPAAFDAKELRNAIKGLGTDEDVLIEILCTRSNAQIKEIIKKYKEMFNKDLEKDIVSDTSGHLKRLLVGLVQANRSDSSEIDRNKAHQDAKAMYEAGEKKWGTDESRFNVILVSRSYAQLRATFEEYRKISKKEIEEVLKSELSGDLLRGMLTIVRCVKNKAAHFARQLQKTMKGLGTDDDTLLRVVISRCEIDMVQIKEEFEKLTGQTLEQFIADDLSGDYRKIILSLVVGGPPPESSAKSGKAFVQATRSKTDEQLDEEVKMESEPVQEDPTVTPAENFNAETDAEVLRKAMKGLGTDEDAIIGVLAYRSNEQRQEIVKTFKTMFGKDLIKELKGELSGGLCKLATGLCLSSADFDATMVKKAIRGLGTDEKVLVEMICTRSNAQLTAMKEAYKTLFGKDMENEVGSDTSGHFKRLLIGLLQATRDESKEFDRNKAKQDAQALLDAGEKKWGTDESRFHTILVSRSYAQLRATFQEYAKICNNDIEDTISSEMSGDLKAGMLSIVRCIRNKAAHFANELHGAMKGLGTDDDTVCRVLVSRCEVDMVQIKEQFQRLYKQTLGMFIKDDISGDYRKLCLALIRDENAAKKK